MNNDIQFGNIIDSLYRCSEETEPVTTMFEQYPFVSIKSSSENGGGSTVAGEGEGGIKRERLIAECEFRRERPNEWKRGVVVVVLLLWWGSDPESLRNAEECRRSSNEEQCECGCRS